MSTETLGTTSQLQLVIPVALSTDWSTTIRNNCYQKIVEHDHTGSAGRGVKLTAASFENDTITGAKILMDNNEYIRGRNAADSADKDIVKVNASDELQFGTTVGSINVQDDGFTILDNSDNTKIIAFNASAITPGTTRTYTFPDVTDTMVTLTASQTLTNKTLTAPTITSATLTLLDNVFTIQDNADATKQLQLQLSSITTGTTRTLTIPDADTTIVGTDATQTLTNKTITIADNVLTIQDNGDATKQAQLQLSGITTGTTRTLTVPDASGTIVLNDNTATLTGKTLTGNIAVNLVSGAATVTLPTTTSTLATLALAETLTNKSIDADTNTITNIENADIKAAAAIALNKLAATTASRALVSDASGFVTAATTTSTEIGYVNGVTSAIQTQLGTKLPTTITTTGDIIYSSSGTTASRLAIGSSGDVLTVSGGVPSWAAPAEALDTVTSIANSDSPYTALTATEILKANATAGAITVNLYAAASNSGRTLTIIKTDSSANIVTIDGATTETINGATTYTLCDQYEAVTIECDGSNWFVINRAGRALGASYSTNTAQSLTTETIVDFEDVVSDPRSLVTTGASWKFTAPENGVYHIFTKVQINSTGFDLGEQITLAVFKNGSIFRVIYAYEIDTSDGTAQALFLGAQGGTHVSLAATDYIDVRYTQTSGAGTNTFTNGTQNFVSIYKI